ncbi:EamA family transporter [Halomonas sp. 1513]|nr:DMT family transporter [Halomonas sp. 1513]APX92984.1 EamA family transporter [Halomonas sp. 1513]
MPTSVAARPSLKADALLLAVTMMAAAGWIFSKEALEGLPPLLFIGTRFLLAAALLGLVGWRPLFALSAHQWRQAGAVGVLFIGAITLWVLGLDASSHLGESAFINSLWILMVPFMARFLFGDRPPAATWLALPVAMLGFACLSLNNGFRVEPSQWLFLASATLFALLFNVNSQVVKRVPPLPFTIIQMLVLGAGLTLISALSEPWPRQVASPTLGWLLASVVIASVMRFWVQLYAQRLTSSSNGAVIMMLEAVWTAMLAALWFRETMSQLQWLGCALIFTALLINRWHWIRRLWHKRPAT